MQSYSEPGFSVPSQSQIGHMHVEAQVTDAVGANPQHISLQTDPPLLLFSMPFCRPDPEHSGLSPARLCPLPYSSPRSTHECTRMHPNQPLVPKGYFKIIPFITVCVPVTL